MEDIEIGGRGVVVGDDRVAVTVKLEGGILSSDAGGVGGGDGFVVTGTVQIVAVDDDEVCSIVFVIGDNGIVVGV